jgi:hypothetical protein
VLWCACGNGVGSLLGQNDFGTYFCQNPTTPSEPVSPSWQVFSVYSGPSLQPRWAPLVAQNDARVPSGNHINGLFLGYEIVRETSGPFLTGYAFDYYWARLMFYYSMPQGATISSAVLRLRQASWQDPCPVAIPIRVHVAADPLSFQSGLPLFGVPSVATYDADPTGPSNFTPYHAPVDATLSPNADVDITAAVQANVNHALWDTTSVIQMIVRTKRPSPRWINTPGALEGNNDALWIGNVTYGAPGAENTLIVSL